MRDAKLIWSNRFGWIGYKHAPNGFVALYIGKHGEDGRRVGLFDDAGEFTSEENAKAFASHVYALLKGELK